MTRIRRWPVLVALAGLLLLVALLAGWIARQPTVELPDYGGVYTEAVVGHPRTLSPIFAQSDAERDLVSLLFRGLTRADIGGAIVPDAATKWEVSDDKLTYTFHLRDDVFWSDGAPVSAADVLFTVRAIQDPSFKGDPNLTAVWRTVALEAVDDKTVKFILTEPFAPFLDQTTLGLLPAHVLGQTPIAELASAPFNTQPITNGPFKLEKLDEKEATLAPNPNDGGRRPYLARLTFRFYPDRGAAIAAFGRHDVLGVGMVSPSDLSKLAEGALLYSAARPTFTAVYLNLDKFMFQDKRTRQALLLGLDRGAIVRQALNGQALVADSPIVPQSWAYNANVRRYPYDPAQAKTLLEQAGWTDVDSDGVREREGQRFEFTLVTSDDPVRSAVADMLAKQWAQLGIRVNVQPVKSTALEQVYLDPREFDAALYGWNVPASDPDPYPLWHSTQVNQGQNVSGWANLEADSRLEQARQTVEPAVRANLYHDFQAIFAEEVPALLLYHGVYHYALDPQVRNVQLGPVLLDPTCRFQTLPQWYLRTRTARPSLLGS